VSELYQRDRAAVADIEKLRFFPLAVTAGEGCHLIEERGRRLLDLTATWAAAPLGYGHRAFVEAVTNALRAPAGEDSVPSPANRRCSLPSD
jgi:4-aminobutyrate aminotransferase